MSLPEMLGGGAECGPVNPLQQLGKRFGQDRGTQFDTHRSGSVADGRPGGFRTRPAAAQDPAFFGQERPEVAPFHVDQMRNALPPVSQAGSWRDMEASFQRAQPSSSHATPATPAWARDFMAYRPAAAPVAAAPPQHEGPVGFAPRYGMQPMFRPHFQGGMHAGPAYQQRAAEVQRGPLETMNSSSWDSAFTAVDAQHRAESAAPATMPSDEQLGAMDADELAETAARLLSSVEHDSSDKFQQSEFLQLMRKLRDRQAEVQGTSIVDSHGQVDKGKGKASSGPPTQADLDAMMREGAEAMQQRNAQHTHTQRDPLLQARVDQGMSLQEFWEQEDAAREGRERAEDMRKNAFIGDGGDVAARMREDAMQQAREGDPVAAEYSKWTSMGGNVPGARKGHWEEDVMTEQPQHEDEDFVGRAWQGAQGRGRVSAQEAEWAKLQSDWDEFEASETGIYGRDKTRESFPFAAPEYRFHENNPYGAERTHHHSRHARVPTSEDSVLEHEAAVQSDPTKADAWYGLGLRQQENEREKQAIAALRKAVEINPRLKEAWLALSVSYTNENDRDAALESIERWIQVNDTYQDVVRSHAGRSADRHKRLASTLMAMARSGVAGGDSIDADVQVALGVLFNSCGEYDKAVDCFGAALEVRPDDWLLYNRIGATLSNSGRARDSLEYYHQALGLRPGFARCHFNLSISCLNLKMYQEAAEHSYTALTLQHASEDDLPHELRGIQNNSLWEILRVSLELMQRPDLARKCEERDVNALQLEDIIGL